jgi:hypothetical protein
MLYNIGIDRVLEELAKQNAEQRELLNSLSDSLLRPFELYVLS